ncbi:MULTISPECIES: HU family DNA-binding protein [Priestia]|jgi:DNA-binding protein HU-beta|uniref:HU family DNA-binding protein n=1 Tax=Priestia TaxID=2800373 RepID=UPI000649E6FF|nr:MULTISPECIES: HU family DNA-binding protein [Priestia]MBY0093368.1 HU family DNA-binding protein [Priestia aryabhattai]MBY0104025.1 HU family DNA-binding protein [Priestia aryabhattai]MCF8890410.1 HU family DNA-binding protein [Priestia megaterium]MCM3099708.1 HU family DNA-binding protein [Priestia megaterium]MCM3186533.1 HU family DNA-binding protein [Priestia megaterium]
MNKTELVDAVATKSELTKQNSKKAVEALFETISNTLAQEEKIQLVGFGTFEIRERAERTGRNPQTGEEMTIPASKAPAFKPGKELKEAVK